MFQVVVTNQMTTRVGERTSTVIPALGESWGHAYMRSYVGCPESFETVSISQKLFERISCNFTQEYNIIS